MSSIVCNNLPKLEVFFETQINTKNLYLIYILKIDLGFCISKMYTDVKFCIKYAIYAKDVFVLTNFALH